MLGLHAQRNYSYYSILGNMTIDVERPKFMGLLNS